MHGDDFDRLRWLLRRLRQERSVTQRQLAERIALAQPRIAEYEAGKREIRALELFAILEALGLSMQTFWRRWQTAPLGDDDS